MDAVPREGMVDEAYYVGVDRAGGHYLAIIFQGTAYHETRTFETPIALWKQFDDGHTLERVCIDVPIGLPSGPAERECDKQARTIIGDRYRSVFRVPVRQAVYAESPVEANTINKRVTGEGNADGKGIPAQSMGLRETIRDVDTFLCETPATRSVFEEVHPEVCFRAFAGDPLSFGKTLPGSSHTHAAGVEERLQVLAMVDEESPTMVRRACEDLWNDPAVDAVSYDDVLDAMAAALTARPHDEWELEFLGADKTDGCGCSLQMAYRAPAPFQEGA